MTPSGVPAPATAPAAASDTEAVAAAVAAASVTTGHPLEDSARLAWQASAAVGLLERFGDLLAVALDAVGNGHDATLASALAERERLMLQLEPLLAALAGARQGVLAIDGDAGVNARRALATILRPVDEALRHAQHLHLRLADEAPQRPAAARGRGAPLALIR
ncbi:MAG: hypothetical protein JO180_07230 [Gemmatirosa sp.]|nr:hypothetical protein [Gemmatirosa sp.]